MPPMEFSRQEYWSKLSFPPPRYLPNPGIEPRSPTLQVDCVPAEPQGRPSFIVITHSGDPALEPGAKSSDSGVSSTGFPTQTQEPGTAEQGHKPGTPEADNETLGESKP